MTPNALIALAGAAGFEPADAGTKNHNPPSKMAVFRRFSQGECAGLSILTGVTRFNRFKLYERAMVCALPAPFPAPASGVS